jgi:hypothetical protein
MMGMLDNNRNATVSCFGLDASLVNQVVADTDWTVSSDPNWDLTSSAMRRANSVVAGAVRPRLDLKRGELAVDNVGSKANYIQAAWLASFMLLIALNVGFWIRGSQYVAAASEQKTIQANIFEDLLPGQNAPVGILSRLESELLARQEQARKELDLRQSRTLLNALHDLLVALPGELPFQIELIALERAEVRVQGFVKSTEDLEQLMVALRNRGFEVKTPTSNNSESGFVDFTLLAEWRPSGGAE